MLRVCLAVGMMLQRLCCTPAAGLQCGRCSPPWRLLQLVPIANHTASCAAAPHPRRLRNLALRGVEPTTPGLPAERGQHDHPVFGSMTVPARPAPRPAVRIPLHHPALAPGANNEDTFPGARTMPLPAAPARPPLPRVMRVVQEQPPPPTIPEDISFRLGPRQQQRSEEEPMLPPGPASDADQDTTHSLPAGGSDTPQHSLTQGSSGGGLTGGSKKGRRDKRPGLPAWWKRSPSRGPAADPAADPTSPETSLTPAQLRMLARDLQAQLAAERQPADDEEVPLAAGGEGEGAAGEQQQPAGGADVAAAAAGGSVELMPQGEAALVRCPDEGGKMGGIGGFWGR